MSAVFVKLTNIHAPTVAKETLADIHIFRYHVCNQRCQYGPFVTKLSGRDVFEMRHSSSTDIYL